MSNFKLYPVPQSKLYIVKDLLTKAKDELKNDRADVDESLAAVENGYTNKRMGVYVDDLVSPKHCLILALMPGLATKGMLVTVLLIYSVPEERGRADIIDAMMFTIDNYATLNGATDILGSSWKYKGARGIDSLWLSRGYEIQETVYVKTLQ
jgi:hypothetical protein